MPALPARAVTVGLFACAGWLEVFLQKSQNREGGNTGIEISPLIKIMGRLKGQQVHLAADGLYLSEQSLGLFQRNNIVVGSMQEQHRRHAFADVGQRAGLGIARFDFSGRAAKPFFQLAYQYLCLKNLEEITVLGETATICVKLGEIGGREVTDHRLNRAGLVRMAPLSFEVIARFCKAEQAGQATAPGKTEGSNSLGINVVFAGAGTQKANGTLDIMTWSGKTIFGLVTKTDGNAHIAFLGQFEDERDIVFSAFCPRPRAVNDDHGREGSLALGVSEIEQLRFLAVLAIRYIGAINYPRRRFKLLRSLVLFVPMACLSITETN